MVLKIQIALQQLGQDEKILENKIQFCHKFLEKHYCKLSVFYPYHVQFFLR